MRTFIAIKFPPKVLMQIKEIQDTLPECSGRKTELKNLHLTLKFLGDVSSQDLEKVKLKLREINLNKFEAEITDAGFFDNQKSQKYDKNIIIWLGITNCDRLQKEIDNVLEGIFQKEKKFMSHLTIARVKRVEDKNKLFDVIKKIEVPKMFFILDKFYLMESVLKKQGSEYNVLEEYALN
jgi:2'-5' RNA ligase